MGFFFFVIELHTKITYLCLRYYIVLQPKWKVCEIFHAFFTLRSKGGVLRNILLNFKRPIVTIRFSILRNSRIVPTSLSLFTQYKVLRSVRLTIAHMWKSVCSNLEGNADVHEAWRLHYFTPSLQRMTINV